MESLMYIPESKVQELLHFDPVYQAVKIALESVSQAHAVQNARGITIIPPNQNRMYTMPGYLQTDKNGILGCKIVSDFPNNVICHGLPSISANVLLMDEHHGGLKAVIGATALTLWRTAAASAVATHYLHSKKDKNVLAIIGAGDQGRIHALTLQHHFSFKEVRIWNRTTEKAKNLVKELNQGNNHVFVLYETVEDCVDNADVIVTATSSDAPLVYNEYIKRGAHINVVGVNGNNFELDQATYKASDVYVDSWEGAKNELSALNVQFKGQIGDVITGLIPPPNSKNTTVFQSLGMAVEDCAVAQLVYDLYKESSGPNL